MSIKVVGHEKPKKVTCDECGAILSYARSDVQQKTVRDYGGGSDEVEFIECPQCKNRVVLRRW